jgi:hypothetical protein
MAAHSKTHDAYLLLIFFRDGLNASLKSQHWPDLGRGDNPTSNTAVTSALNQTSCQPTSTEGKIFKKMKAVGARIKSDELASSPFVSWGSSI